MLQDVPNFQYVYIHIGNDDDDTAGCLLVGMGNSADDVGFINGSKQAYMKIYPIIRDLPRCHENYSFVVFYIRPLPFETVVYIIIYDGFTK